MEFPQNSAYSMRIRTEYMGDSKDLQNTSVTTNGIVQSTLVA